jgi:hypothetical protein
MIPTIRSITIFLEVKPLPKQKPIPVLIQSPSESQQQLQNNHSRCAPSVDVTENNRTTMTTQLSAD